MLPAKILSEYIYFIICAVEIYGGKTACFDDQKNRIVEIFTENCLFTHYICSIYISAKLT